MLKQDEIQAVIGNFEVSNNFEWYCDERERKVFAVRGPDGGVVATYISYLFYKPDYQESPFDGFDLGRSGLHKWGNKNKWFCLEFRLDKTLDDVKDLIQHAIDELSL